MGGPFGQKEHLIFQRFSNLNVNAFVEVLFEGNQAINYSRQRKNVTPRQTSYFLPHLPLIRNNEKKRFGYPSDRHVIYAYANSNTSQSVDDMIGYFLQGKNLQGKNAIEADNQGLSFAAFAYSLPVIQIPFSQCPNVCLDTFVWLVLSVMLMCTHSSSVQRIDG
jgi:hypothetical protein